MYDNKAFSYQLTRIMDMRGITQKELASTIGIAGASISRYVTGNREPDIRTLVKLAEALHVSIDELVGFDVPEPVAPPAPPVDVATLVSCYARASEQDRDVLWSLLSRYMKPAEKAAITALREKKGEQVG